MTTDTVYPVSLLLDGPLFSDELETQPQHFKRDHEIDTLRIVPSRSAASGVHTIYFKPEDRHWALVRLASRYRGLFEILLQRGMSGENLLLKQGFSSDDLGFLLDIVPHPPDDYSPIVYDILWLAATYDEYLALAETIAERDTFVPRDVLRSTPGLTADDRSFFTRFLRSHLIRPNVETPESTHRRSNSQKADRSVELDAEYEVTNDGRDALRGIVGEHERIFERQEFEPLLINPELDPLEHLKTYEAESSEPTPDVSLEEMSNESGIIGEIAASFDAIDRDLD